MLLIICDKIIGEMASQANTKQLNLPLPRGAWVDNYEILKLISSGGFSFVYLAHDENRVPVVLKEYLPSILALRTSGSGPLAPALSEGDLAKFRYGMKCFFEEGRALAHISHPNVVRVQNFLRFNDTVYLAMRFERGRTLQEHIKQRHHGSLGEAWLRDTFSELLNGLREVHTHKLLHLDIKPANVYLRNDGSPVLIDFGAARQALSQEGMKLPPTYTPGFAAPEQHSGGQLGPWTDIYAVGATLYTCLSAASPPRADERMRKDELAPARRAFAGKCSEELLEIIDWCLQLDHNDRPQSVFELQKALRGEGVK
jgi:hypothetical protein